MSNIRDKLIRCAAFEEAAFAIEPKEPKPCDCIRQDIKTDQGNFYYNTCDCNNNGDFDRASKWCESMNNAKTIRGLKIK